MVGNIPFAGVDAKTLGFTVISISADNNRSIMSLFKILSSVTGGIDGESFPNPGHDGETIFLFYDAVLIIKNIRNN
jgi:hypothetical protein